MGEFGNPFGTMYGLKIIDTEMVGDAYEDWSGVRSPSRALRRRKQGHPQRIVTRYRANVKVLHDKIHGVIYMHPHDRMKFERMTQVRP